MRLGLVVLAVICVACGGQQTRHGRTFTEQRSTAELTANLKSASVEVRQHALTGIAMKIQEQGADTVKAAVPALIEATRGDQDEMVRARAAEALGLIGAVTPEVVPTLIDALSDKSQRVRAWTAVALGAIGPGAKAASPALHRALGEAGVSLAAAGALQKIGEADTAGRELEAIFLDKSKPRDLRREAASALGELKVHAAVPSLVSALGDPEMIDGAALALRKLGENAPLVTGLARLLESRDVDVRRNAAGQLWKCEADAAPAIPALMKALAHDADWDVRQRSAIALGMADPDGKSAVAALAAALTDKDAAVRTAAARALGDIGPEAKTAIAPLTSALKDPNQDVRNAVGEALTKIGKA